MPEHVDLTDPELHEPKGVATATANETYVANGAGSGAWSEPEPKGISAATAGQVYVADGASSGAWTAQTTIDQYQRNVSNGVNTTTCTATADTNMPLLGNGSFNFTSPNVVATKLFFDSTYNSSQGGLIIDGLGQYTDIELRITFVNTTGGASDVVVKAFLDDDKTAPGTGTTIVTSPIDAGTGAQQTALLKFYRDTAEAIRIQFNSTATKDYTINGCYAVAVERI